MSRYHGNFSSHQDMVDAFMDGGWDYDKREKILTPLPDGFPSDDEVLFAAYGTEEAYQGNATVVYRKDGKLYLAGGSHCSCYGLEGQWKPTETTLGALRLMCEHEFEEGRSYCDYDGQTRTAWAALVTALESEARRP